MKWGCLFLPLLILSCKTSEKALHQEALNKNQTDIIKTREIISEPAISYVEVPIPCPDSLPINPSIYELKAGRASLKAQIEGKRLRLTARSERVISKDSAKEKILTLDKYIYRDKIKTIKVPYIPKWVWALLIFNVIYFGWTYKSLFVRFLSNPL